MPLKRKVIIIGASRGITLPSDWLETWETKLGRTVKHVSIEVDGDLRITPYEGGE